MQGGRIAFTSGEFRSGNRPTLGGIVWDGRYCLRVRSVAPLYLLQGGNINVFCGRLTFTG
jgi:hypothetical protein